MVFLAGLILGLIGCWLYKPDSPATPEIRTVIERVEIAKEIAVETELRVIEYRPIVIEAREALIAATETRIEAGISIDDLPAPVIAEYQAMTELISSLETQLALEIQRGDAWRDAFWEQEQLVALLREQGKSEKRKGFIWGSGLSAALLLVLL
jgi:hypothetical protein